jgi:hypothetical protein
MANEKKNVSTTKLFTVLNLNITHNNCLYPCSMNVNKENAKQTQQLQWKDQRKDEDQVKDVQRGVKRGLNITGMKQRQTVA